MQIDNFKKIQRVEAPPYLYTRILQKIEISEEVLMPTRYSMVLNSAFVILLIVNMIVLVNYTTKPDATQSYAEYINLYSNNSLY